jgi:septal ring factor EnvC (AmiA/AmiB activator)
MSQPDFNPFDPISAAMGAMHGQNLLAAKDARIKQLEHKLKETEELLKETQENSASFEKFGWENKDRIKQLEERLEAMREAGDILWYCVRHAQRIDAAELVKALDEWKEARNHG